MKPSWRPGYPGVSLAKYREEFEEAGTGMVRCKACHPRIEWLKTRGYRVPRQLAKGPGLRGHLNSAAHKLAKAQQQKEEGEPACQT